MPKTQAKNPADFITPLNMDGLQGRILYMPPPAGKKREVLLIYGHHASLERLFGLAEAINDYAGVTTPDLPGFGGMDSLYKIGKKPSLDELADYLAAVIKLRYRRRRFSIAAVSFGFLVVTRMLQRYPDIAKKVDILISIVGFTHYDEFVFSRPRYLFYRYSASLFSRRWSSVFFRNIFFHPTVLRTFYARTHNAKHKFVDTTPEQRHLMTEFEVYLWRANDARTYMDTVVSMLTVNNCRQRIDLPVHHVSVETDNYFDHQVVEQHMRVVFSDFQEYPAKLKKHNVSIIADKREAAIMIPPRLRMLLATE